MSPEERSAPEGAAMTIEYRLVKQFYGSRKAERSQVPLMNHIDEGLAILEDLKASALAKRAFCLHPLLQDSHDLLNCWHLVATNCPADSVLMAMEYRRAANAYLCRPVTDNYSVKLLSFVVGPLLPEVRQMLIADKLQNQKDFRKYHLGTHPRSAQLEQYFITWLKFLKNPQGEADGTSKHSSSDEESRRQEFV